MPEEERFAAYQALKTAHRVHEGQRRRDGQPFITHPVAVAKLVADWGMDSQCVVAALLHDAVEDTPLTFSEVECDFGAEVRTLVQGVTRVSKLDPCKLEEGGAVGGDALASHRVTMMEAGEEAEDEVLRQALLLDEKEGDILRLLHACAGDWRIAVLKLADRLHNMRTLEVMKPHKRARKAQETASVFVPLAHYLGAHDVANELARLSARHKADDQPMLRKLAARLSSMRFCLRWDRKGLSAIASAVASGVVPEPGRSLTGGLSRARRPSRASAAADDASERNLLRLIEQLEGEGERGAEICLERLYTSLRPLRERLTRHQAVLMSEGWDVKQA